MTVRAGRFAGVAVCAVSGLVYRVFAACTPCQVFHPVVGRNAIQVPALITGRRIAAKRLDHLPMNEGFTRATVFGHFYDRVSHIVQALLEDHARTTHAAEATGLVETLKSWNWAPFLKVFTTGNINSVSVFRHTSILPKLAG